MISIKAQDKHMQEVRGLEESVDYSVSVFAVNQHGVGEGRYLEMKTKADGESAIFCDLMGLSEDSAYIVFFTPNSNHMYGKVSYYSGSLLEWS